MMIKTIVKYILIIILLSGCSVNRNLDGINVYKMTKCSNDKVDKKEI